MEQERFAKPCVGAIIEREKDGEKYLLIQRREKADGGKTNGLLEIPSGKIREYENIFSALRREVREETGLTVTKIYGEEESLLLTTANGEKVLSFSPYCVTQNLSGAYSIVLNTFLCMAEGTLLSASNETQDIRWEKVSLLRELLGRHPERFFFMHLNALKKYLNGETDGDRG